MHTRGGLCNLHFLYWRGITQLHFFRWRRQEQQFKTGFATGNPVIITALNIPITFGGVQINQWCIIY